MKVILDLRGWRKIEDIPEQLIRGGIIEVSIYPPLNICVDTKEKVEESVVARVPFYITGDTKNGLRIFKHI